LLVPLVTHIDTHAVGLCNTEEDRDFLADNIIRGQIEDTADDEKDEVATMIVFPIVVKFFFTMLCLGMDVFFFGMAAPNLTYLSCFSRAFQSIPGIPLVYNNFQTR